MANPLSLIRKAGEVASRSKPFYSAVDEALSSLPNKALGEQMVKELLKKGVKPQEIIDRNLDAILGAPIVQKTRTVKLKKPDAKGRTEIEEKYFEVTPSQKGEKAISRADVERAAAENPAPQVGEAMLFSPYKKGELDNLLEQWAANNSGQTADAINRGESWINTRKIAEKEGNQEIVRMIDRQVNDDAKFAKYSISGGENYREVLLMIPTKSGKQHNALQNRIDAYEAQGAELRSQHPIISERSPETQRKIQMLRDLADELRQQQKDLSKKSFDPTYRSHHWEQPNVLAHARVSDRTGPNGEKILHVEEIQSDWHQKGRKEGYRTPKENVSEKQYDEYVKDLTNRYQERLANTYAGDETDPLKRSIMIPASLRNERDPSKIAETMGELDKLQDMFAAMYQERNAASKGVPDAPFKSTWHELVMKRLLDDAARNGYDRVVITPGKTQIDRYEDAFRKNIDSLEYEPYVNDQGKQMFEVSGIKNGQSVFNEEDVTPERLRELLGKDMHEKIMSGYGESLAAERPMRPDWKRISNEDISIGGEGMKGFYDQIIPSYLNKYGEKWGAKVQPYSYSMEGTQNPLHAFDITPQMREEIVGKGQPLYQVVPPAIGAGALMQEEEPEPGMKRGGAVNADAIRMAVWNKQLRKQHG